MLFSSSIDLFVIYVRRMQDRVSALILDELLPSRSGPDLCCIEQDSRRRYLDIIEARVKPELPGNVPAWLVMIMIFSV